MRLVLASSAALTAFIGLSAVADSMPPTIDQAGLAWRRPPSLEVVRNRFPVRARIAKVWKGQATVSCTANSSGELKCSVLDEKPAGLDFGKAGVIVMQHTRVRAIDGASPAGRTFRYGIKFGAWPTPDRYQPKDLQWTLMPTFGGWSMKGMKMGDVWSADFTCVTHASGDIDCRVKQTRPDDGSFRSAALRAMNNAKVADRNGASPQEGYVFDYTLKVMRLNWCGTGGYRLEGPASVPMEQNGGQPIGGGAEFIEIPTKGSANSTDRGATCTPALAITV